VRFESTGDRLTIDQTRRNLRIAMWLVVVFGALGAVIMSIPASGRVRVACSRAEGRCTVQYPHQHRDLPLSTLAGVQLSDQVLELERTGNVPYHLCSAPRNELSRAADQLSAFLNDPTAPAVSAECTSTIGVGVPWTGRLAGVGGMLIIVAAMGGYLVEAHTVVDSAAGTIVMRGSSWPFRRWSLERPLADVSRVAVLKRYTGRGGYMYLIDVCFADGSYARAFSPASYRLDTLNKQIAVLQQFVRPSDPAQVVG